MGVVLGEVAGGEVKADLNGAPVECRGFGLLCELLADDGFDGGEIDGEELRGDADVDHIFDELAKLGFGAGGDDELIEGDGVVGEVGAAVGDFEGFVEDEGGAGLEAADVVGDGVGVHGDEEIDVGFARDPAVFADADGVPGGETGDVGWEEVFAGDGDSHAEDAAEKDGVCGLRARAVDGGDVDGEVVGDGVVIRRGCGDLALWSDGAAAH